MDEGWAGLAADIDKKCPLSASAHASTQLNPPNNTFLLKKNKFD